MKQTMVCAALVVMSALASCSDKGVYDAGNEKEKEPELDLSFKFAMKSSKTVSISATDGSGNPGKGVLFNIYGENPLLDEGFSHDVEPLYTGYTNQQGLLSADIALPENIKQIYVYPVTAGFGSMQQADVADNIALTFQGLAFPTATSTRAGSLDVSSLTLSRLSSRYNIHCLYEATDVTNKSVLIIGKSPLVSKEVLPTDFLNLVNTWYPEAVFQDEELLNQSCDIVVTDDKGAEVWVTYIGDGGFNQSRCVMMYYNYEAGELTSNLDVYNGEDPDADALDNLLHMTMAFPNTNQKEMPAGTKVQLLYWNKKLQKYETIFPKGTYIGFAFGRVSNKGTLAVNNADNYWFSQPWHTKLATPNRNYPDREIFYSTPALNSEGLGKSNAIIRSCPSYNCITVGMDARYWNDPSTSNDKDFNDLLFKVVANPPEGIAPENTISVAPAAPFDAQHGTLAFEDLWPSKGDYDFNDLVVDYTYRRMKTAGGITEIQLEFQPLARGGSVTSGFGIELPFSESMVKSVTGARLEQGNQKATFIVWENSDDVFGGHSGIVNTYKSQGKIDTEVTSVTITLASPLGDSEVDRLAFNPFIFVGGERGHEIHLVDFAPTSKVDKSFFGQADDRSNPDKGVYYRMDNTYPWALDIPRTSSSVPSWRYPEETKNITAVYLNYGNWVKNQTTNTDWFDSSVPGNVDKDKLY